MNDKDNIKGQWGVPDFYFDGNKSRILQKIEIEAEREAFPKLYALKQNVFEVPNHYFEDNAAWLQTDIGLLKYIGTSGFIVPEAYFADQAKFMTQKLSFLKPTQNFAILPFIKRYRMHAAAAVIVMSLSFFGLDYYKSNSNKQNQELADASLVNGIDVEELEEHDLMEQIDEQSNEHLELIIEQQLETEDIENSI